MDAPTSLKPRRSLLAAVAALPLLAGAAWAARPHRPARAPIELSRLAQHPALRDPTAAAALLLDAAHDAAINTADSMGTTALMTASFRGDAGVVRALLARGAEVDRANRAGQTALMFASLFARHEARALLLSRGADPRRADRIGNTADSLARYAALGGDVAAFAHRAADDVNGRRPAPR